jgi:hypothetical protein
MFLRSETRLTLPAAVPLKPSELTPLKNCTDRKRCLPGTHKGEIDGNAFIFIYIKKKKEYFYLANIERLQRVHKYSHERKKTQKKNKDSCHM